MLKTLRLTATTMVLAGSMLATAFAGNFDVNKTNTGLALRGYDPVAYFTVKTPTPGSFKITTVHQDVVYRFSSEENKALFVANPAKYVPQFGGFCAYGLANGVKVDADPVLWTVRNEKLYLNLAPPVQALFSKDPDGFIKSASAKWSKLKDVNPLETVK